MRQGLPTSILFVFHEAERTGASIVLFRYVKWLSQNTDYRICFLLNRGGPLEKEMSAIGKILYQHSYKLPRQHSLHKRGIYKLAGNTIVKRKIKKLQQEHFDCIIANTLVSAIIIDELKQFLSAPVGWYIHELALAEKQTRGTYEKVVPWIALWIANSNATREFIEKRFGVEKEKIVINYPPVIIPENISKYPAVERWQGKFVIGTSGSATHRKGCDLFLLLAISIRKKHPVASFHFVWVGNNDYFGIDIGHDIAKSGAENMIEFTGEVTDPFTCYKNFDVFVSTSREESFGLACIEAAAVGKPVIGFEGTGELEKIISGCNGKLVPYMDIDAMADAVIEISRSTDTLKAMGAASEKFALQFSEDNLYQKWLDTIATLAAMPGKGNMV